MPLKTEPLEEPSINLTSMLDVVMLLIVFFMVGTKFSEHERLSSIQVPTVSDNLALSGQPDDIIVNVTSDGAITVMSDGYTLQSLQKMLESARESFPGQSVVIRGDGNGKFQLVADVLSACRMAGIKSIKLAHSPDLKNL